MSLRHFAFTCIKSHPVNLIKLILEFDNISPHKSQVGPPDQFLSSCKSCLNLLSQHDSRSQFMRRSLPFFHCTFLLQNLNQNPRTLLPKFFGLYCVQSGGKNIRMVVMNNVLPRVVRMHLKYDLKGSTYKRRASKKEREKARPTFKDLDFMQDLQDGLMLDQDTYNALVKTLQRDCLVRKLERERERRGRENSIVDT